MTEKTSIPNLTPGDVFGRFTVQTTEDLPEIEGRAYTLSHPSGAKLLYLANNDPDKAFSISFRTPPEDSTGVFHILEHSVLCGSDRFPLKEPFVNLLKNSMQTFLNAMTFPDKTMYPVASTNEADLYNLMDVYLDAVFHPAIYQKETIFQQEGWHYEFSDSEGTDAADAPDMGALMAWLEEKGIDPTTISCQEEAEALIQQFIADQAPEELENADTAADAAGADVSANDAADGNTAADAKSAPQHLIHNGVVFNEMKGALSTPEAVIEDDLCRALFPDTCYAFESGGDPDVIPELTYEQFLANHAQHYRLDNSYTILYGDLHLQSALDKLEEHFSAVNPVAPDAPAPRTINLQAPVITRNVHRTMVAPADSAAAALGYVVGTASDRLRVIAADVLMGALMGSNEAPLKRAILDTGICRDCAGMVVDCVLQPFILMLLRGSKPEVLDTFEKTVADAVTKLVEEGIPADLLEAELSHSEFVLRERNFGVSDGVAFAMASMSGWLYDDDMSTAYIKFQDDFAELRAQIGTGFFEQLARELFLENDHFASVDVICVDAKDAPPSVQKQKLQALEAALTPEAAQEIADTLAALREAQETPDSPEALATLPQLTLDDLGEAFIRPEYRMLDSTPVPCIQHDVETGGIVYVNRFYDMSCVSFDELPYVSVLALVLGALPTADRTAVQVDTMIQSKLGTLTFTPMSICSDADARIFKEHMMVKGSALASKTEYLVSLVDEIMLRTDFSDTGKIKDILTQRMAGMEIGFANRGNTYAMNRAFSYLTKAAMVGEYMAGIDFYRFIRNLLADFDNRAADLSAKLAELAARIFRQDNLVIGLGGTPEEQEAFWSAFSAANPTPLVPLPTQEEAPYGILSVPEPQVKNEAFAVTTDITYTAMVANRYLLNEPRDSVFAVVSNALSFDYLWNEVRVKGGAYGCSYGERADGSMVFSSYRDPHVDETVDTYRQAATWLETLELTPEALDGFIISAVSGLDKPIKPGSLIGGQDLNFLKGVDPLRYLKSRQRILELTMDDLHAYARRLRALAETNCICSFGNREILESSKLGLTIIDPLNE